MMKGVGGPLLYIGDLLSNVGESDASSPLQQHEPSISAEVQNLDLFKLFQDNYAQLNEALVGTEYHSWAGITLKGGSLEVICPGDEIPRWLSYQSDEGCEINIKFPHLEDYSCLSFALAAVLALPHPRWSSYYIILFCAGNFKTNDSEDYERELGSRDLWGLEGSKENHLVLICYKIFDPRLIPLNRVTEASFRFYVAYRKFADGQRLWSSSVVVCDYTFEVNKCGVHVLYK